MKVDQLITLQWPLKFSERKRHTLLTLSQKLEIIRLWDEGVVEGKIGRKIGLLHQPLAQGVKHKGG